MVNFYIKLYSALVLVACSCLLMTTMSCSDSKEVIHSLSEKWQDSTFVYRTNSNHKINDADVDGGITYYEISVQGLPTSIDCDFGLSKVYIDLTHKRTSDIKITLIAPSGEEVWLTNRNGTGPNYINTFLQMNGSNGFLYHSNNPFKGAFIPDGNFLLFNSGVNPNGIWRIKIEDFEKEMSGAMTKVELYFSEDTYCNAKVCSFDTPENCAETNSGELLPDLILLENLTLGQYKVDTNITTGDRVLHFTAAMANIGNGPLEVIRNYDKKRIDPLGVERIPMQQVVYSLRENQFTSTKYDSGEIYYDDKPGHGHYHMDDWVHFRLLRRNDSKNYKDWDVIAVNKKISYCLFDTHRCDSELKNCIYKNKVIGQEDIANYGLGNYFNCDDVKQGLSVGSSDYYGMNYEGQSIVLPSESQKEGEYFLKYVLDPKRNFKELDILNNSGLIKIEIN